MRAPREAAARAAHFLSLAVVRLLYKSLSIQPPITHRVSLYQSGSVVGSALSWVTWAEAQTREAERLGVNPPAVLGGVMEMGWGKPEVPALVHMPRVSCWLPGKADCVEADCGHTVRS